MPYLDETIIGRFLFACNAPAAWVNHPESVRMETYVKHQPLLCKYAQVALLNLVQRVYVNETSKFMAAPGTDELTWSTRRQACRCIAKNYLRCTTNDAACHESELLGKEDDNYPMHLKSETCFDDLLAYLSVDHLQDLAR